MCLRSRGGTIRKVFPKLKPGTPAAQQNGLLNAAAFLP